ncbi:TolC family protein [Solimonas sp. K1W22B-7]|uniref:TolC family protein n=1 Tax=Solimonas sp. K1W22B-7 TaxID=2303331 RepID=UPI0013C51FC6|nr:TolC family protein [Solimonas sp. K1W22B-7]
MELTEAVPPPSPASTGAGGDTLSLREAVERGLQHSPRLGSLAAEEARAQARLRQQRAGYLPQLDLSYRYGRDHYENISVPAGDTVNRSAAEVRLSQPLFRGFATRNGLLQREAELDAARGRSADGRNQLALEIGSAYADVLAGRRLVDLAAENLQQHQQIQESVRSLVNSGVGRRPDIELGDSRISIGRSELALQTQRLRQAEARFRRWVGVLPGSLEPLPELSAGFPRSLDAAVAQAQRQSDVLRPLRDEVESAGHAYRAAKAAWYPQLDMVAAWSSREDHDGIDNGFRDEDSSRVELVASLKAFDGGLTRARVAEQAAQLEAARFRLAEEEQRLRADLEEAWSQMEAAEQRHEQFDRYQQSTAEVDKVYRQQFAVRLRSLLDLLDAIGENGRARAAIVGSEQERQLARMRVLAGMGVLADSLKQH